MLSLIVLLPLLGAGILVLVPPDRIVALRRGALVFSVAPLVPSCVMLAAFRPGEPGFQLAERVAWIPEWGISYALGVDGVSLFLVLLSTVLTPLVVLWSWGDIHRRVKEYFVLLLVLETGMNGTFLATDLFLFYVFWELMLVPMYFLIGVWGGPRRVYAALKFVLFTMVGSLLMLVAILYLAAQTAVRGSEVHPEHFHLAAPRLHVALERTQQRALARAARPDDGHAFAARDLQRFEREHRPVFSVSDFDVFEADHACSLEALIVFKR